MSEYLFCPVCATGLEDAPRGGRPRRVCPREGCGWVHWNNPAPVVAAILERGENVVLVRGVGWPEKMFGLVTGFLESGESPGEAVVREVREELGVDAEIVSLVGVYEFLPMNQVIMAYHLQTTGVPVVGEELSALREIPISKLRPWAAGTGAAVADWLARRTGSGNGQR